MIPLLLDHDYKLASSSLIHVSLRLKTIERDGMVTKQRSIFEFSSQKSICSETIDLTEDDDQYVVIDREQNETGAIISSGSDSSPASNTNGVKRSKSIKLEDADETHSLIESSNYLPPSNPDSIQCPICSISLDSLSIEDRSEHVNGCAEAQLTEDSNSGLIAKPSIKHEDSDLELFVKEEDVAIDDAVRCPICSKSIDDLAVEYRTLHVENCLGKLSLDENASKTSQNSTDSESPKVGDRKRKRDTKAPELASTAVKKLPYLNTSIIKEVTADEKVIKPPTTIRRSAKSRRSCIPEVKVLTFDVIPLVSNYQISVDAFCYSPNDAISQYFLTHFHGDHYGGISKNWCYERVFDGEAIDENGYRPIVYCTEVTGKLLTLRFSIDKKFIQPLKFDRTYRIKRFDKLNDLPETELLESDDSTTPGLYVTPITANHCPGAAIFLFKSISMTNRVTHMLHCGDFRVNMEVLSHPSLQPFLFDKRESSTGPVIDKVYLDTTYMNPDYNFPKQELVCDEISKMINKLTNGTEGEISENKLFNTWFGNLTQSRITDFLSIKGTPKKKKFLVLVGTYLIGKENLAIAISKKLGGCPIYVSNVSGRVDKYQILKTYENEYLTKVLSKEDVAANSNTSCVIHLVPMNIVGNVGELSKYFNHNKYFESFERCIGLRPTGWTFSRGGSNRGGITDDSCIQMPELYRIMKEQPKFSYEKHILPQAPPLTNATSKRLNSSLYRIYTLPYSEHSSFRELSYFSIMLSIGEIIPTVNIENDKSVKRMQEIIDLWQMASTLRLNGEDEFRLKLEDF